MANTVSWSSAVAAVHADPILFNASPPIAPSVNFPIPAFLGEASKQQRQAAPYAIWHPGQDRYSKDPSPQGPATRSVSGNTPRWIWTRWVASTVFLHCLQPGGPSDFDTMELTLNAFIAALHRTLRGAYQITGGTLEPTHGTELLKDRKVYTLNVEIATPITEVPATGIPATITSAPVTAGINTPTNPPN